MSSPAFAVVDEFERQMAAFSGAKHGVAVASCTDALFLSFLSCKCKYLKVEHVVLPARTYISVPMAVLNAGGKLRFVDYPWTGTYALAPYPVYDGALRMKRGMYGGGFHCLSFHMRKLLPIGRGGMILTDDAEAVRWFRKARLDGRNGDIPFMQDKVDMIGWNCYMTPEQAARGLQLLEAIGDGKPDLTPPYPDLREMPVFKNHPQVLQ